MTRQPTRRIEFTVPDDLGEQYDEARGDTPMATWIKAVLGEQLNGGMVETAPRSPSPAVESSRALIEPGDFGGHAAANRKRQAKLNAAKAGKR